LEHKNERRVNKIMVEKTVKKTAEKTIKKILSRADILDFDDFKMEEVAIPEWGGSVWVKALNGSERDSYEASTIRQRGANREMNLENVRAKLVALSVINPETKEPLFTAGDIEAIGKKNAAPIDRIYTVAQRLSKFTQDDIDELTKN